MSLVTKPLATDDTLQDVVNAVNGLTTGYEGKTAYESAVDGGYTLPESQFNNDLEGAVLHSNQNLLDNWYFIGGGSQQGGLQFPINQQLLTAYSGNRYTIDRWKNTNASSNLSILPNCVRLGTSGSSYTPVLQQNFENPYLVANKTVTFSALVKGPVSVRLNLSVGTTIRSGYIDISETEWSLVLFTTTFGSPSIQSCDAWINIAANSNNAYVDIAAVKLEIGDTQTLAHQENGVWVLNEMPDFETQLLRCQRYYHIFRDTSIYGYSTKAIDCRPVMRADPVTGTFTIDEITYTYLDANF